MSKPLFPEHDKLHLVAKESQICGEFIDWIWDQGYCIVERKGMPLFNLRVMLAKFFKIDEVKLEKEKQVILKALKRRS